jgi:hypothetical protein
MRTIVLKTFLLAFLVGVSAVGAFPKEAAAQTSPSVAPTFIPVSGRLLTAEGQARSGQVLLVISLYEGQSDTAPRWIEHQQVTLDAGGGYSVQFGATREDGLPADLFTSETGTRWLGVAVENEPEQPRVMLVSVPYAAKAASAETLGGKSASDFVLTSTFREDLRTVLEEEGVTGGGEDISTEAMTLNFLQKSTGAGTALTDSTIFESGGNVGIGTASPSVPLDVRGSTNGYKPAMWISDSNPFLGGALFFEFRGGATNNKIHAFVADSRGLSMFRVNDAGTGDLSSGIPDFVLSDRGNIGIHTPAPLVPLHVRTSTLGYKPAMWVSDSNPTLGGALFFEFRGAAVNNKIHALVADSRGLNIFRVNDAGTADLSAGIPDFVVADTGNVGVGTAFPTAKLHVSGNTLITGNITVDGNIAAKYQDVAEWVDAAEPLEAGTVVIIDVTARNRVRASTTSYDTRVAGAVSPQPGLVLGEPGEGRVLVAQSGRVRIKADTRNGAIKPGDLLVTSPRAGYAMKGKSAKAGTVLGKALEPLEKGTGEILVLLTLQ